MGDVLAIRATAWPRNGRLGQWAVGLESSLDPASQFAPTPRNSRALAVAPRKNLRARSHIPARFEPNGPLP